MSPKIIAHCLVKNEERFIWYSIMSVLPYVDRIMIWDTGSTDKTIEIINSISSPKIIFKEVGNVDANSFTNMRQEMIKKTPSEFTWIMILDGDEIWTSKNIKIATDFAKKNPKLESIVVRTHNLVGDIYHKASEIFGNYRLAGQTGHLNLRFMNTKTIKGLHAHLPHGQIGYFDENKTLIQDRSPDKIKFLDLHYAHATHLPRSSADIKTIKRSFKKKYELGEKIKKTDIPEVFFSSDKPDIVPDVTNKAPFFYWIKAAIITPPRLIKRLLAKPTSGY